MASLGILISLWAYKRCPRKHLIDEDIEHWQEILGWEGSKTILLKRLLSEKPEFRNLFGYRIGQIRILSKILQFMLPPMPTLFIWTQEIGGGLFIQHGFATVLAAKKIGRHCFVNQQVTIGYKGENAPVIGDNVMVTCGAKILGDVNVGDNAIIGANAVVVKDVPANAVMAGVPARILRMQSPVV